MASLELKGLKKVYPKGVVAVKDFNLTIDDREFIVLVGPSGCAKSIILRMIAGLEDISEGILRSLSTCPGPHVRKSRIIYKIPAEKI